MDVDGTLTDGKIYMGSSGEVMKAFNIKDGQGIASAKKAGMLPIIITARKSKITKNRCVELDIQHLYQGFPDKTAKIIEISKELNIPTESMAYIGDDLNDLGGMKLCGYCGCPKDAAKEIKNIVDYICVQNGGDGAVREFLDKLIELRSENV